MTLQEYFAEGLALVLFNIEEDWFTFMYRSESIDVRGINARGIPTFKRDGFRVAHIEDVRRAVEA